jgi:cytochrome b561
MGTTEAGSADIGNIQFREHTLDAFWPFRASNARLATGARSFRRFALMTVSVREIHSTYDRTTIVLHWLTALLFGLLWIVGQTADLIPDGPVNTAVWSSHVVLGFALAAIIVFRVAWRLSRGRRLPPPNSALPPFLAATAHHLLYLFLAIVLTLGVINAFVRGYNLFDWVSLPQIGDKSLRHKITEWHGLCANLTLGLVFIHVLAALTHQYVWRDRVLARMLPSAAL